MHNYPECQKPKPNPDPHVCPGVGSQTATVCLPVAVSPYAHAGPAMIHCCGEPIVVMCCNRCRGKVKAKCEFTISQKIQVEIPVEFGATVDIGDTFIDCGCGCDDDDEC